ncbi:MAG: alpha/beta fold hydrolase [Planctomycetota bacterium]
MRSLVASMFFLVILVQETRVAGRWQGSIDVPGNSLAVTVELKAGDGGWSGAIDIPAQGLKAVALAEIEIKGEEVRFTIAGLPGTPTFEGKVAGDEIRGTLLQGGVKCSFRLGREGTPEAASARPIPLVRAQDPKPPFPYGVEEVTYTNGEITLAGTLTIPEGEGPFPAVLLITGSGAQNRDEEIMGHRPFLVIADYLTRQGIAVLRVDDRGVGGSTGNVVTATTADFATDVIAGVRFLRARPDIATDAVGVLGHSEGGLVGPLAASQCDEIAFVIMLAGTGVRGDEVLYLQGELLRRASGGSEELIESQRRLQRELFKAVEEAADEATLRDKVRAIMREQAASMSAAEKATLGNLEAFIETQVASLANPWMRFFITYDPRPALRKVEVPVLALNGEKDLQVWYEQNLPEIEKALQEGGNEDVTIRSFPGLNHLFQKCETGNVSEYAQLGLTIELEVLDCIADWIQQRF